MTVSQPRVVDIRISRPCTDQVAANQPIHQSIFLHVVCRPVSPHDTLQIPKYVFHYKMFLWHE